MISTRYAIPVALLLLLALVPTVIHTYFGSTIDDRKSVKQIDENLAGFDSQPSKRNPWWGKEIFDSEDWIERIYGKSDSRVRLFAARSYNQKRLYHHPEIALSRGIDLRSAEIVNLEGDPEKPVHLYRAENGPGVVAYVLLYGGKFIKDPISYQILDSFRLLFGARGEMTIIYVYDASVLQREDFNKSAGSAILSAAIESFQRSGHKIE